VSFLEVFSSLAQRLPDEAAILAPERAALTFGGLLARIAQTKDELNRLGIGRGDRVAIALSNGPDASVCVLACMACASAAPLDPSCTEHEFRAYLGRVRPKALILPRDAIRTTAHAVADELATPTIVLTPELAAPAGTFALTGSARACRDPGWNTADDTALILLTSGSTSRQKLVPLKSRHLVANAFANGTLFGLSRGDRSLHVMPLFHGAGVKSSLTVPLLNGTAVVCLPAFEVSSFFRYLDLFRPTWFTAGYAFHQAILDAAPAYRECIERSRLRFIRSGTGRLDPDVMRGLEQAFRVPAIEQYSSSETCTIASKPLRPARAKPGTVGVRVLNEFAIMGPEELFLGADEEGEIVVRGPSVFDGYLDDPEANAAAFVDGWYRTGDLGRIDAEGFLTITGRTKETINRGGEKISPREVETALAAHPAIGQIKTFGIPHPTLGQEVAAAVVLRQGTSPTETELRTFAATRLADFKVPRRIFFRSAFPLGSSKKLDLRRLVRECEALMEEERNVGAVSRSLSATEERVRDLWCKALGKPRIGVDDDFFLLGGDSLKAVELLLLVEEAFGVQIPASALYGEGATVAKLAAVVDRLLTGEAFAAQATRTPDRPGRVRFYANDLVTALTLLTLTPAAWVIPSNRWRPICQAIARAHIALKGSPAPDVEEALARLDVDRTPHELRLHFLSGIYHGILMSLREHLPAAWRPPVRLDGAEHINAARAAGRGAVLWSCPTSIGGLIAKKALRGAGFEVVSLRSAIHPYSASWMGAKLLNPASNAVEDRYVAEAVIVPVSDGLGAFQQLRAHLAANRVVSIAANGAEGTPYQMPFLGGTLKLSLGAPMLAALHDAPLLPLFAAMDAEGFEIRIGKPISATRGQNVGETARELARAYVGVLEAHLRRHPADWRGWFMPNTWTPSPPRDRDVPRPASLQAGGD
jgi:acyl-CoA synthetase (AMP-forming)/AMP-acid ligase II/acyl carrier protein/lauroyl/myristoyl acyltransferase